MKFHTATQNNNNNNNNVSNLHSNSNKNDNKDDNKSNSGCSKNNNKRKRCYKNNSNKSINNNNNKKNKEQHKKRKLEKKLHLRANSNTLHNDATSPSGKKHNTSSVKALASQSLSDITTTVSSYAAVSRPTVTDSTHAFGQASTADVDPEDSLPLTLPIDISESWHEYFCEDAKGKEFENKIFSNGKAFQPLLSSYQNNKSAGNFTRPDFLVSDSYHQLPLTSPPYHHSSPPHLPSSPALPLLPSSTSFYQASSSFHPSSAALHHTTADHQNEPRSSPFGSIGDSLRSKHVCSDWGSDKDTLDPGLSDPPSSGPLLMEHPLIDHHFINPLGHSSNPPFSLNTTPSFTHPHHSLFLSSQPSVISFHPSFPSFLPTFSHPSITPSNYSFHSISSFSSLPPYLTPIKIAETKEKDGETNSLPHGPFLPQVPPTPNTNQLFPLFHVNPAGIIEVLLRNNVLVQMTPDRALRVVNHNHQAFVATNDRCTAVCVHHAAAKVQQERTSFEVQAYGTRRAKASTDSVVFGDQGTSSCFSVSRGGHLSLLNKVPFKDLSSDLSQQLLSTSNCVNSCLKAVQEARCRLLKGGAVVIYVNSVKIQQSACNDVTVTSERRRLRVSPISGLTMAHTHFVDISIEADWSLRIRRGGHKLSAGLSSSFVLANEVVEFGFDAEQKVFIRPLKVVKETLIEKDVKQLAINPFPVGVFSCQDIGEMGREDGEKEGGVTT